VRESGDILFRFSKRNLIIDFNKSLIRFFGPGEHYFTMCWKKVVSGCGHSHKAWKLYVHTLAQFDRKVFSDGPARTAGVVLGLLAKRLSG